MIETLMLGPWEWDIQHESVTGLEYNRRCNSKFLTELRNIGLGNIEFLCIKIQRLILCRDVDDKTSQWRICPSSFEYDTQRFHLVEWGHVVARVYLPSCQYQRVYGSISEGWRKDDFTENEAIYKSPPLPKQLERRVLIIGVMIIFDSFEPRTFVDLASLHPDQED